MQSRYVCWAMVQDFIYGLQEMDRGHCWSTSSYYHRFCGAAQALAHVPGDRAGDLFEFAQWASRYLRTYEKGQQHSPEAIACLVGFALRFSVGAL